LFDEEQAPVQSAMPALVMELVDGLTLADPTRRSDRVSRAQ
jgi:hypothetical protein